MTELTSHTEIDIASTDRCSRNKMDRAEIKAKHGRFFFFFLQGFWTDNTRL